MLTTLFIRAYPIEDGFPINIPQRDPLSKTPLKKTFSASNFYSYRSMERQGENNYILLYRSLLKQFLVDMYAKIETERLHFIRYNQSKLRAENYIHLKDEISKGDWQDGRVTFHFHRWTPLLTRENSRRHGVCPPLYGRPDLFITFTCNPKWTKIESALREGQQPQDRHDIIARVFHLKVKKLIHVLT